MNIASKSKVSASKLLIRMLTEADIPRLQEIIRRCYVIDEPIYASTKIALHQEGVKELNDYCAFLVKQNCSFIATSECGDLRGVSLNHLKVRGEDFEMESKHWILSKVVQLKQKGEAESKIFDLCEDVDVYFKVDVVSVDTRRSRERVGMNLLRKARDFATQCGIKLMRMDCTSLYSAKAAERLGFTKIYGVKYQDYKIDGKPVFKPDPPHTEFAVYIKRLDG